MTVHGLVLRVFYQILCPAGILGGRILPTIRMLELKIRVALQLANGKSQSVMLSQIAIAAATGGILYQ